MKRKIIYLIILFCAFSFCLSAQSDAPLRIELPTAQDADDYHFALMGNEGLLVFYEGLQLNKDSMEWVIMAYDTNLQRQYVFNIILPPKAVFRQSYYNQGKLFILYQEVVGKKESPKTYVSEVNIAGRTAQLHVMQGIPGFEIATVKAVENHVVFSIINDNSYWIYFLDTQTDNLQQFYVQNAAIISEQFIEIDSINKKVLLGLGLLYSSKIAMMAVLETNYSGKLLKQVPLPSYEGYYYNTVRLKLVDSSHALIMGTYNLASSKKTGFYHSGVYTLTYDNSIMGNPEFYNYTNLHREDSVSKKKEQALDLQLLVGEIISNDSSYSLITEVYYPEYNYSSGYNNNSSYYYGSGYNPTTTTFAGYRYINAYITCFDKRGKLLWDHYLPFTNILTQRLARRVSVFYTSFGTAVFYPYNSNLTYSLIDGHEVLENSMTVPIESNHNKDMVEYSRNLNMYNWYDNKFIICGYQYIVNNSKGVKGKRYVFFINKLEYR